MPKGVSIHIGVNEVDPGHYAGWSGPLVACEADADDLAELAEAQGFSTTVIMTGDATREAVTGAIASAATQLESGDIFFLSYSGHGGQVPDATGEETDAWDETWCLHDGQLLDDELFALWPQFAAGVRVLVVSDSCHSGTVTRAPVLVDRVSLTRGTVAENLGIVDAQYRAMPRSAAIKAYRRNRDFYVGLQTAGGDRVEPEASVRLLSACQDNQYALDGDLNGLFTGTLLAVWDLGTFKGSYVDLHSEIGQLMPATQSPNHTVIGPRDPAYDAQTPFTI
jgi:hypothetical protein